MLQMVKVKHQVQGPQITERSCGGSALTQGPSASRVSSVHPACSPHRFRKARDVRAVVCFPSGHQQWQSPEENTLARPIPCIPDSSLGSGQVSLKHVPVLTRSGDNGLNRRIQDFSEPSCC